MDEHNYAGFWIRAGATIIDSVLLLLIIMPILVAIYGTEYLLIEATYFGAWDILLSWVMPGILTILFWIFKSATPGKMILGLTIVDIKTGGKPSSGQFIGRYLGYLISAITLLLGFIWIGFDKRKQGLHDKPAGTVVVRKSRVQELVN